MKTPQRIAALAVLTTTSLAFAADTRVTPFRIEVPDVEIAGLKERLASTRWPSKAPVPGWQRGVPLEYLKELSEHWRTKFDWRAQEAKLNELPQFTTTIDGLKLHFVHVKSKAPKARPLLLLHGWPGSFVEFQKVIEPLTRGAGGQAFHVIVPSLPGFGFSEAPAEAGWGTGRMAGAMLELMKRLGYEKFAVHGNDTGAIVARELAVAAPRNVAAMHVTQVFSFEPPEGEPADAYEKKSRETAARYEAELSGYMFVQSQCPQTLAYALTDSPVGQLAWLADLFQGWTDNQGNLEDAVSRDHFLTNVSIYWFTRTAGPSSQVYAEASAAWGEPQKNTVPTGVAVFPKDGFLTVKRIAAQQNEVVHFNVFEKGGHFAAMEQPEVLVADLRRFFAKVWK
ncbi:MAG: epoxide hydrolase [Myxococcaceae bacterium]|nr:epoxide hydrolase [Myxococcaceae bacterium]